MATATSTCRRSVGSTRRTYFSPSSPGSARTAIPNAAPQNAAAPVKSSVRQSAAAPGSRAADLKVVAWNVADFPRGVERAAAQLRLGLLRGFSPLVGRGGLFAPVLLHVGDGTADGPEQLVAIFLVEFGELFGGVGFEQAFVGGDADDRVKQVHQSRVAAHARLPHRGAEIDAETEAFAPADRGEIGAAEL